MRFTDCIDITGESCKKFVGKKIYISTGAVDVDHVDLNQIETINYDTKPSRANLITDDNSILFAKMQETKKVLFIDKGLEKNIYSTGFFSVSPKKNILNKKCLYHLLESKTFLSQKDKYCSGATQKSITLEGLNKIEITIPNLEDQDKIVKILDSIKVIIESYKKEIKKYDELIKARFVEMFGDYLKEDRRPLSEVAIITGGLTKNSNRNTFETKMPYLRVANVFYNRLDLREILKIGVKEEEIEKTLLQAGDLLFVEGNGSIEQIGRVAIWDGSIAPILHQNHLIKARFNNEIIAPEYALFYFMLQDGRQQIISKSVSTSGLNTLSVNKVSSLLLPIPPIALQKQFSVFVKLVDKSRFEIKKSIIELEREVVYD